jgi:hypothetical protein
MKTYLPVSSDDIMSQDHTRPTFVPDSLDDLKGPTFGIVTLPQFLDWTPLNTYDLSSPSRLRRLYETVLSEAMSEDELARYIDASLLISQWHQLRLPKRVRFAWESAYPELV